MLVESRLLPSGKQVRAKSLESANRPGSPSAKQARDWRRYKTLGSPVGNGKPHHRAYFAKIYASTECEAGDQLRFAGARKKKRGPQPALLKYCRRARSATLAVPDRRPRDYTLYVLLAVVPPRPVQLVWKNSPRGLSTRS